MNDQTGHVANIDVGTPPIGFRNWATAAVNFHGFADLPTTRDKLYQSPEFSCLGGRWYLDIYPGGSDHDNSDEGMMAVFLYNDNVTHGDIDTILVSLSVRNAAGEEVANIWRCEPDSNHSWGAANFAKRSEIMDSLVEGTMTIDVKMKRSGPPTCSSAAFIPKNPICQHVLKMFMDEGSADVVFEVGGQQKENACKKAKIPTTNFHAHRLILQSCAPDLADMCGPGSGKDVTSVPIAGVKPDVFKHMLYYVYGGEVPDEDLVSSAKDLIDAADKFGVVTLKLEAEACYVKSTALTIDNILDHLLYAESKNCALLKEVAMDFMVENASDVMTKVSFKNVPGTLMPDLLAAMERGKKKGNDTNANNFNTMRVPREKIMVF